MTTKTQRVGPVDGKLSAKAIREVVATTMHPNPKDLEQGRVLAEGQTRGLAAEIDVSRSVELRVERDLNEPPVPTRQRDFRITKKMIEEYGYTPGCIGCESYMTGSQEEGSESTLWYAGGGWRTR